MKKHYPIWLLMASISLAAEPALAHPGHVHGPGPAHGLSWLDLALFLAATIVVPAALLFVRLRGRCFH